MTETVSPDPVSLTANLPHQLHHAVELRKLAYSLIVGEHRGASTKAHRLATLMLYRSMQTHRAIEVLIREELVEDARSLSRALVELTVNCAYMYMVGDDSSADDFTKFPAYKRFRIVQGVKHADPIRFRKLVSEEREEELGLEHEALKPRFKGRGTDQWCADGKLYERAAKVDAKLSEALNMKYGQFLWMVNSEWRLSSSYVHGMADSMLEQISQNEENVTIQQKFDPQDAATALYTANFALGLCLPLLDGFLGGKRAAEVGQKLKQFTGNQTATFPPDLTKTS